MLASPSALFQDLSAALSQQKQQQQQQGTPDTPQPSVTPPAGLGGSDIITAAEVSALQAAMQQASTNLAAIQQDPLLAGELSAVGGYWLLRRFMPALQDQPELILKSLGALPGLGYKVGSTHGLPCKQVQRRIQSVAVVMQHLCTLQVRATMYTFTNCEAYSTSGGQALVAWNTLLSD